MMKHSQRLNTVPKAPSENGWKERHMTEVHSMTHPVTRLVAAWLDYADFHRAIYASGIGDDYVLGVNWSRIGAELLGLLNGDCGQLDCGTLDGVIRSALTSEGFDPDTM